MAWNLEPAVITGCLAAAALYFWSVRTASWARALAFLAADILLLLALISPLDTLADHLLFSAHMVQHLLLLDLCAPLFVLALPAAALAQLLRRRPVAMIEQWLRHPARAWAIGFLTLALWHLPTLYDAALRSDATHALEHFCFLVSACIFWWPVLAPAVEHRLAPVTSVFYLFSRMAADLVLGCFIYALPLGVYAAYAHAGALPFGLTPLQDQRLGGILMWAPTLVIDMAAAPLLLTMFLAPATAHTSASIPASMD